LVPNRLGVISNSSDQELYQLLDDQVDNEHKDGDCISKSKRLDAIPEEHVANILVSVFNNVADTFVFLAVALVIT
jgi:hypothetical protein